MSNWRAFLKRKWSDVILHCVLKWLLFCTRMHSYIDVSRVYCRNHWFELGLFAALMFSILTLYLLLLISSIPKKSWTGDFLMKRGYEVTSIQNYSRLRERILPRVLKIVIKPIGLLQVKRCVYHNSFSGCGQHNMWPSMRKLNQSAESTDVFFSLK